MMPIDLKTTPYEPEVTILELKMVSEVGFRSQGIILIPEIHILGVLDHFRLFPRNRKSAFLKTKMSYGLRSHIARYLTTFCCFPETGSRILESALVSGVVFQSVGIISITKIHILGGIRPILGCFLETRSRHLGT